MLTKGCKLKAGGGDFERVTFSETLFSPSHPRNFPYSQLFLLMTYSDPGPRIHVTP